MFTGLLPATYLVEKKVSDEALENIPELYKESQAGTFMNFKSLAIVFLYAAYQAAIIFIFTMLTFSSDYVNQFGFPMDYWYVCCVVEIKWFKG